MSFAFGTQERATGIARFRGSGEDSGARRRRLPREVQELFFDMEKQDLLPLSHPSAFCPGLLMVVPHEVKDAMDKEEGELFLKGVPSGTGLAEAGVY